MAWAWLPKVLWIAFGSALLIGTALNAAESTKLIDKDAITQPRTEKR